MDKLELLTQEITIHVGELGLLCFPKAVSVGSAPIVAHWPGEDWKQFLAFAPTLGVSVVYVGTTTFDYENEEEATAELAEHDGQTDSVLVAYVAGGVVHAWSELAPWRVEAIEEAISNHGNRDERVESLGERAEKEGWARTIAYDRRFYAVASTDQHEVGDILLAELAGLTDDDPILRDLWRIVFDAHSHLAEVRESLTDEGLNHKSELAAELSQAHPDWSSMRVALREKYARTLVKETYGMTLPIVAGEVARYK